jgi:(p)ppGpp synthase/HD superfamily hydrolase
MSKTLDIEMEKAMRLLSEHLPASEDNSRKPILLHDIRVGVYLYENNYSREIILAGILHDALEFCDLSEQQLKDEFGEKVLDLVKSRTKENAIEDADERIDELILRCSRNGKDALIIKAAEVLDGFKYYTKENNKAELEYCQKNAQAIFKYMPGGFEDKVFEELGKWYK